MRGKRAKIRKVSPDAKYGSEVISRFINYVMLDGKKHVATKVVYGALEKLDLNDLAKYQASKEGGDQKDTVKGAGKEGMNESGQKSQEKKVKMNAEEAFMTAIGNIKPRVEIRSRRIGGANYQIPMPVNPRRQESLALRWLITATRDSRGNTDLATELASQITAAFKGEGAAVRKKEDTHKMAEANQAFAQFA